MKLFLIIVGLFILSSCCTEKYCDDNWALGEIQLRNFNQQEIDSIAVVTYQKNTNFTQQVDSFFIVGGISQFDTSLLAIPLRQSLDISLDYKIVFISINKVFLLTGFSTKKEECNSCVPWGYTYYNVIGSYYVNGQIQYIQDTPVQITKL